MRTAMRGKRRFGEGILVFVFLGVLCLALLAVVLLALSGESRRSRLALEHEAEEFAMALLMMSMGGVEAHDLQGLERRVAGFGLYREDGTPITRSGTAPEVLSLNERSTRPGAWSARSSPPRGRSAARGSSPSRALPAAAAS